MCTSSAKTNKIIKVRHRKWVEFGLIDYNNNHRRLLELNNRRDRDVI